MILLLDIGNTHTHAGLAAGRRLQRRVDLPTRGWQDGTAAARLARFVGTTPLEGSALCSVVPLATRPARAAARGFGGRFVELTSATVRGVGVDYPRPRTIGPDRLANAIAVKHRFGAPALVVDFGTAVTFDVVNRAGNYAGGVIAPGLAVMTDYLHEKTALLPRIRIRDIRSVIGRSTREAMLVGAVHGYRGLVRELIHRLREELGTPGLPVVATGPYAALIARGLPEIRRVVPSLTLEGLRLLWESHFRG